MKHGKNWFQLQIFFIANVHVLGLLIPKKCVKSKTKLSVCHATLPALPSLYRRFLSRLKSYRFEISATLRQLGWIDAPHTQNFEILESLEQTQESKKFKITFEIFVKMLYGLNFGKRCLLRYSIRICFLNRKFLKLS
jgi:hypothetical protein